MSCAVFVAIFFPQGYSLYFSLINGGLGVGVLDRVVGVSVDGVRCLWCEAFLVLGGGVGPSWFFGVGPLYQT